MAFASAITSNGISGNYRRITGTFTNAAGDSGGEIETGLNVVVNVKLQHTGAVVVADNPGLNETLPHNAGDITIVTKAGADGIWVVTGY